MFYSIQLSKSDPTPLYIQLANEISNLIQSKIIQPGTKLPAIRSLSANLKINRDTVVSAYKLLENQGLIEGHIGRGTYVSYQSTAKVSSSEYLDDASTLYCSHLNFPKDLYPVSLCKDLAYKIIDKEGWSSFSDPLYRTRNLLKQNICKFLSTDYLDASSSQIRIIKNYDEFLFSLFKLSSKQGICVEQFHDLTHSSFLKSVGGKVYEIPLEKDGMNLNYLEKYLNTSSISYIMLSSSAQNPTGICYSEEKKHQILELAKLHKCYIIEDGTYSIFTSTPASRAPLASISRNDQVIFICHFSKIYLPYLSYSFAVLPSSLIKRLCDQYECTFNDRLLSYYLESPYLTQIKEEIIRRCKKNYLLLYECLQSIKDKIEVYTEECMLYFWLKPLTISFDELNTLFMKHHIIAAPGGLFSSRDHCEFFRLSLSNLSTNDVIKICSILKSIK